MVLMASVSSQQSGHVIEVMMEAIAVSLLLAGREEEFVPDATVETTVAFDAGTDMMRYIIECSETICERIHSVSVMH